MFFGISQPYIIDIYGFYFGEYMPGYLVSAEFSTYGEINSLSIPDYVMMWITC